ncbi:hypothetical protein ACEU0D_002676 [Enterobacter ludwigii]|uniref:hypothetical protein n=1 Tax=Enterobacter ludwigii TaxID=299767 RepID=UPI003733D7D6
MGIDENTAAEMQIALVRICRMERNAHGVWHQLQELYPEYTKRDIQEAVRPALRRMMDSLD